MIRSNWTENTLFVQLLVGGRLEREGTNAKLLRLMALITLALAPVALLLMIQIKFLPYHSEGITWLHRGLLALDLVLVWTLWPGYRSGWGVRLWPKGSWWLALSGVLSAVALVYAVAVATFPDEQMYFATKRWHGSTFDQSRLDVITPVNTLDLHGEDLIDDAKLKQIIEKNESSVDMQRWVATLSLMERDLTGANLKDADVRHVDFSGAILNRAKLDSAWAERAQFNNAKLHGASLQFADLHGASLNYARLQGASLDMARLQGASLRRAQLQGASLWSAQLQGASLKGAGLQGASLNYARLQGASLDIAIGPGVGSVGINTQLQGATLDQAELQGASLDWAQLQGASFVDVCVWRADARQAVWVDTRVERPKAESQSRMQLDGGLLRSPQTVRRRSDSRKHDAVGRIEQRLDPTKALQGEDEMAKIWAARERGTPAPEAYAKSRAGQLRELGCAAEGAPYVLYGLVAQLSDPFFAFQ